jgi:hypothetical protein
MNFERFVITSGIVVLAAVIVFSWGCQQNQPTAPQFRNGSYIGDEGDGGGWNMAKARDDCDCGTCEAYGTVYPVCCDSLYGWHSYDGGCNRLCVGCRTCIEDGSYSDCKACKNCAGGGPSPEHPYDYPHLTSSTTTIETTTTTTSGWWWGGGAWWGGTTTAAASTTTTNGYTTTTAAGTTTTASGWWGAWW